MPSKHQREQFEEEGHRFAGMLYELPIKNLLNPSDEDRKRWVQEFPKLDTKTMEQIIEQVHKARLYQQERVGWQAIPRDLTVILFVLGTLLIGLKIGIIISIASLVFLESLFQFVFDQRYYRPLSLLVWLTYPAFVALGFYLYQQDYAWYWILLIILALWFGTYILGPIARIPMRLLMGAKKDAQLRKTQETKEK